LVIYVEKNEVEGLKIVEIIRREWWRTHTW